MTDTNTTPLKALIVEDSRDDLDLLLYELRRGGYHVEFAHVETAEAMRVALKRSDWQIVFSDYSLPGFGAMQALQILREVGADIPFIIMSGTIDEDTAINVLKSGAHDFLVKGRFARLLPAIERELREADNRKRKREADEARQRLEKQLHTMQRLDALGKISGGVAHDFNNVLTVIQAHAYFLRQRFGGDADAAKDIEAIASAVGNAQRLTGQLLAFGRRQVQQLVVLNLNRVVADIGTLIARTMPANLQVSTNLAPDLGNIRADVSQIEQVVMNLVVNARDAMPHGGRLMIETANVDLSESYTQFRDASMQPGAYIQLAVSDTGTGMDAETQARIFEPFFSTKADGANRGTGLGLATVYGIVKQSNGYVWVYSEPNVGSTFKVYFPRVDAPMTSMIVPASNRSLASNGNETVLVVEDQAMVRSAIVRMLSSRKYNVIQAENGTQALAACARNAPPIDLLVADVMLPDIGGPDLYRRAVAMRPDLKVIFMSGYTDNAVFESGLLERKVAFVQKPFGIETFLKAVRDVLDAN